MSDEHNLRTLSSYRNHLLTKYSQESVDVWGDNVHVETPHIDSIAEQGVLFSNFYTSVPQCTPARSSFLTGKYPYNNGALTNGRLLGSEEKTWANVLQDNGYYTSYIGKWHLDGKQMPGWDAPDGREFGFNHTKYRYNLGDWKCYEEFSNGTFAMEFSIIKCIDMYGEDLKKHYTTDFFFDRGIDFIENATEEGNGPFALFLSVTDPHGPNTVRPPYDSLYSDVDIKVPRTTIQKILRDPAAPSFHYENKNSIYDMNLTQGEIQGYLNNIDRKYNLKEHVQQYFGMVKLLDDKVGELLKTLKDLQIDDETIVIFTSDHGDLLGEHGRVNKNMPYKTSVGVPLIIKYPNKVQGNMAIETVFSQIDFAPTLLGLLNLEHEVVFDGLDKSKEIMQNNTTAMSNDTMNIVFSYSTRGWIAAITSDLKYIIQIQGAPVLFDLDQDPDELYNVVADPNYSKIVPVLRDAALKVLFHRMLNEVIYLDPPSCSDSRDLLKIFNGDGWEVELFCENLNIGGWLCKNNLVKQHCPIACGVECGDSTGELRYKGLITNCAKMSRSLCQSKDVSMFCPETCDPKCFDDEYFEFRDWKKKLQMCPYIMKNKLKAATRRKNVCKDQRIANHCKWSCGLCKDSIIDDEAFKFYTPKTLRPCYFISNNNAFTRHRQKTFCNTTYEGVVVNQACAVSCGNF